MPINPRFKRKGLAAKRNFSHAITRISSPGRTLEFSLTPTSWAFLPDLMSLWLNCIWETSWSKLVVLPLILTVWPTFKGFANLTIPTPS